MKLHGLTPMVFSRQENSSLRSSYLPVGRQVFYAVTKTEHAKFLTPILQIIMTYDHMTIIILNAYPLYGTIPHYARYSEEKH